MQVDHVSLIVRLTVPEKILHRQLSVSASQIGGQLASAIDKYCSAHALGYYPAIEYFRHIEEFDQDLLDSADSVAWSVSRLVREEVQSRLGPIFSSIKFQSIQTEAFTLPSIRPNQPSAFDLLVKHYTPDTVKLELQVSLLRKDDDLRGEAVEGYARKMIYRWLKGVFDEVELTASVRPGE